MKRMWQKSIECASLAHIWTSTLLKCMSFFPSRIKAIYLYMLVGQKSGLILQGGNGGDCLHAPWSLPWCLWNAPVEVDNFLIGCPSPRRKCLDAPALSKLNRTGLLWKWLNNFSNRRETCMVYYTQSDYTSLSLDNIKTIKKLKSTARLSWRMVALLIKVSNLRMKSILSNVIQFSTFLYYK